MNTKTTTHGDMLRAQAGIEYYRSRGDFTSQYLRDAAGIIDAQAEEIERLRSIHQDIGGIGGCADGSGMRAVAAVAEANKRADKAQSRVVELEGVLLAVKFGEFSGITCDNVNGRSWFDARDAALAKRSAE